MNEKTKRIFREYVESILIALALALLVRAFVIQAFKIPTGSMRPTLLEGDRILVNKFIYRFSEPERGDIVVFKYPENPKRDFIKRLVGKSGDHLEIRNGRLVVNDEEITAGSLGERYYYNQGPLGQEGDEQTVPDNSYFVLGDNSAASRDSRFWGFVPRRYLVGKALVVYWPPSRIRGLR
ncbi:MAG: signal peptidase I [Candidatus Omnitrophota bacterium]